MKLRVRWQKLGGWGLSILAAVSFAAVRSSTEGVVAFAQQRGAQADKTQAFEEEFEKGRQLLQRREYFEALKTFQRANQLAGGRSADCFLAMARAMHGMKAYQNAVGSAQSAIDLAQGDKRLLARAHSVKGLKALQSLAEQDATKLPKQKTSSGRRSSSIRFVGRRSALQPGFRAHAPRSTTRELSMRDVSFLNFERTRDCTPSGRRSSLPTPRRAREKYAPDFWIVASRRHKP
jgi:hypothetical protein